MPLFYKNIIDNGFIVAIWKIDEDESFFLNKVEPIKEIANSKKRLQHLAARFLLYSIAPQFDLLNIKVLQSGKPVDVKNECFFSLSHCGSYASVVFSSLKNVAIDIETLTAKAEKIKHKFLNEQEQLIIKESNLLSFHQNIYTLLWSAKETMFKWYGKGNVDFKKMLKINDIDLNNNTINASIISNSKEDVIIHYLFFDEICLTYIC